MHPWRARPRRTRASAHLTERRGGSDARERPAEELRARRDERRATKHSRAQRSECARPKKQNARRRIPTPGVRALENYRPTCSRLLAELLRARVDERLVLARRTEDLLRRLRAHRAA